MKITKIESFTGWLSLTESSNIEDNQFEVLTNMFYNKDKRIQTRKWIDTFWNPVPDTVIAINECNATTNFVWTLDATTIATWTAIRWTFSLSFMIDVSNDVADSAIVTNASLWNINITTKKWYLGFWLYVPTGFNTALTAVKVRLWSNSTNYYEWTLWTLTEASNNFIKLNYSDASTTWTPVDTTINYFRLEVTYAVWYTDKTWVLIDSIYSYSPTSTKPITSYFFYQNDTTWARNAFCTSSTNMFLYDETSTSWEVIRTWLSEFESNWTTLTRWSFAVYLNKVYMCNWVDSYTEWNWILFTDQVAQPKPRYLRYMADSIYWWWVDAAPSTMYATAAWASDAKTINANDLIVWWDELWKINWIRDLWNVIMVWKNKKIYSVSWDLATSQAIDSQNWWFWHRAIANVENGIMYFSDEWINTVKPRTWIVWATAMATETKSDDLKSLLDDIVPAQYNNNAWFYNTNIKNYYFSFDTWNDSTPDTTLVYSALVWAWSQYNIPALYDYGFYIDSDWDYHYLIASANWWQMYEIETWFTDNWTWIETELKTKKWDFWDVWLWKTFDTVDIQWLKNEWSEITIEVLIDWDIASSSILDDIFISWNSTPLTIWAREIWKYVIWWEEWEDLFPYLIRIPVYTTWPNIQIRMYSSSSPNVWTLEKIKISRQDESMDIFPLSNIS